MGLFDGTDFLLAEFARAEPFVLVGWKRPRTSQQKSGTATKAEPQTEQTAYWKSGIVRAVVVGPKPEPEPSPSVKTLHKAEGSRTM